MHFTSFVAVATRAEAAFLQLVVALVVILVAARLVVPLVRRLGQTDVIGEVLAGLMLGPSLLGALAPQLDLPGKIFPADILPVLGAISSLGLVFLMFQLGQEFEFTAKLGDARRVVSVVSVAGIAVPFALGYFSAPWFLAQIDGGVAAVKDVQGFRFFFAIALSVTAIPVLGRIFLELGLTHTRTATVAISCAALEDVAGWLLLGAVSLSVTTTLTAGWLFGSAAALVAFVVVLFFVVRPLLRRYLAAHLRRNGQLRHTAIGVLLAVAFLAAGTTSVIGVHPLVGGFALGIALHDQRRFVGEWKMRVAPLVNTFFLPIFFTFTGLRTNVAALGNVHDLLLCLAILVLAIAGKFGGCYLAARLAGESNRDALTLGVCMNTRGLVELVVLNVGYELGLIPQSMFTMLVIMAVVTTMMATPLIARLLQKERAPSSRTRGKGVVAIELPAHVSSELSERARQGVRAILEALLTDRAAANRVSDGVGELVECVAAAAAPWSTGAPRLRVELDDGRVFARVSVDVGLEPASKLAARLQRGMRDAVPARAPASAASSASLGAADAALDEVVARLGELNRSLGWSVSAAADGNALSVEGELAVAPSITS